jgi:hypothetical protein
MFPLSINQNTVVNVTGKDAAGNAAPITITSFAIDNHAMAYAVQKDSNNIAVVSKGPEGNFTLTVVGASAAGVAVTATLQFGVVAGDATVEVLTPSAPAGWSLLVPDQPSGW